MKKLAVVFTLLTVTFLSQAQNTKGNNMKARIKAIEDRNALKELVDKFSNLADRKEVQKQMELFTTNAVVENYQDGKAGGTLAGHKDIAAAFTGFLNLFQFVYHLNGQQTFTINGNKATGVLYCLVTLIGTENGKKMKTILYVHYNDDYINENGKWLIEKRKSFFDYSEKQEMTN